MVEIPHTQIESSTLNPKNPDLHPETRNPSPAVGGPLPLFRG